MVEFDSADEANTELLEKLKHLDVRVEDAERGGLCRKGCWKSLKWKSALNHIGLLVSLSIYCGVGGLELFEESCPKTARHFECLVKKEDFLIEVNTIRNRLSEEPDFLIKFVENFILAEQSSKLSKNGNKLASLKLMYQNMLLLETKHYNYDWLVEEVYDIVMSIIAKMHDDKGCHDEIKMRLYYKFGRYLFAKGKRLEDAIKYLTSALELARGEKWITDIKLETENYMWMSEAIAQNLAESCLLNAKRLLKKDPKRALQLSVQAVCVLASVNTSNKKLLNIAALSKVSMMIECQQYDFALRQARKVQPYITRQAGDDTCRVQCKLFLYKGLCFYHLNDLENALYSFYNAHILSKTYNLADLKAHIQMSIGRIFGKDPKRIHCALDCYKSAKAIYTQRKDYKNVMLTTYLLAKIKMETIFPEFVELLKSSESCKYYSLRQWKNRCKPFWKEEEERRSQPSEIFLGVTIPEPIAKPMYSLRHIEEAKNRVQTDLKCLMEAEVMISF